MTLGERWGNAGDYGGKDFFFEKKKPSPHPSQKNRFRGDRIVSIRGKSRRKAPRFPVFVWTDKVPEKEGRIFRSYHKTGKSVA